MPERNRVTPYGDIIIAPAERGRFMGNRVLVDPPRYHGIVGVCNSHDPAGPRYLLSSQPFGVARAVPALMVGIGHVLGILKQFVIVNAGA